jgi:hypothetical protein
MHAVVQSAESAVLPFVEGNHHDTSPRRKGESLQDWLLALREAHVSFRSDDRLVILYGHPIAFRVALYAAAERALAGESIVYLDGANTFDPFWIGRLARARRRQPRTLLSMIHVARAYTRDQMDRLVSDCLLFAMDRYQSRIAILSGLFDTHYDGAVSEQDQLRVFSRIMEASRRLTQQGRTLMFLCPQPTILTRASRRCLDQALRQANRTISIRESEGIMHFDEDAQGAAKSWQVARSLLDPANAQRALAT